MNTRFIHLLLSLVLIGLVTSCNDLDPNFVGEIEFDGETYELTTKDSRIIKWHCWDCYYTKHYNLTFEFNLKNQDFGAWLTMYSLGDAFEGGTYFYDDYEFSLLETETGDFYIEQTSGGEEPDFSFFNSAGFKFSSFEDYHRATSGTISVEVVDKTQLYYKLNFELTIENKDGVIKPLTGFFHGAFERRDVWDID